MRCLIGPGALLFVACSTPEPAPPVVRPVRTLVPAKLQGEQSHSYRGVVQAGDQADLGFKVGGRLATLAVEVGDVVTADQLLAELDSTELQLQLSQADASLAQARASARVAKMLGAKPALALRARMFSASSSATL